MAPQTRLAAIGVLLLPLVSASPLGKRNGTLGPDADGKYWIHGAGISAAFIKYGAAITNLHINDKRGIERDIVAGFDNATYYETDTQHPYFGGVPGRYANRIKNSSFEIDGETFNVLPNEHATDEFPDGVNTLHGGPKGWDWRNFSVVAHTDKSITFSIVDPDGEQGFPGEVVSYITYTMGDMRWDFEMTAFATTKKTPIMLTSHAYWNLDGFANDETNLVFDHSLHMPYGGQRVAVDDILIPTGDMLANLPGSPNDFWSAPKPIGTDFEHPDLEGNCGLDCTGYDNCYLVDRVGDYDWEQEYVASVSSPWSGIKLDIYTEQEAFQFYSCNFQDGSIVLKKTQGLNGDDQPWPRSIPQYGCLVVEVQDYIDGINQPEWHRESKQIFGPGDGPYVLKASYRFSVEGDE